MESLKEANQLLQLLELTQKSVHTVIDEWAKQPIKATSPQEPDLPSRTLFEAQRTLLAVSGKMVELVASPSDRLLEVSSQYNEARCLHIAAAMRVPDFLAKAGDKGVGIDDLAVHVKIEPRKLARLMRCLCSIHIFREVQPEVFANNNISAALVGNDPLRAYIVMFSWDLYTASDALPKALLAPASKDSYAVTDTAFQRAVGTNKERWVWLEEGASPEELQLGRRQGSYSGPFGPDVAAALSRKDPGDCRARRPELDIFGLAMLGGGKVFGAAHLYDFPWQSMGDSLVVDVGGGVGGFCIQLSHLYPQLRFVVQDRAPALEQAQKEIWPRENPTALEQGRVQFMPHDFFAVNPVKGADIYWLRYILHDWSDDYCIRILQSIRASMSPTSRILICDQVMNTTVGCEAIQSAPAPLPANYGYFTRYSHQRDITMMSIINGIERTPHQFKALIEKAGLVLSRIYDCRSQVSLVECVLPAEAE